MAEIQTSQIDRLEALLQEQLGCHTRLYMLLEQKREAIRTADAAQVESVSRQEHMVLQQVTELEKQRLLLAGEMTELVDASRSKPLSVSEIAAYIEPARRDELLSLAGGVREAIVKVQQLSQVIRAAAEALSAHMAGVLQLVHSAVSQARVYGRSGRMHVGSSITSSIDVRS